MIFIIEISFIPIILPPFSRINIRTTITLNKSNIPIWGCSFYKSSFNKLIPIFPYRITRLCNFFSATIFSIPDLIFFIPCIGSIWKIGIKFSCISYIKPSTGIISNSNNFRRFSMTTPSSFANVGVDSIL